MGQSHSSPQPGTGESGDKGAEKKDYYELLEVKQNASPEEIKKAYRRKALELHPDRNYGNVEAATNLFAEIQAAYEVLSDPQERSWYDSHRDAFLGGERAAETTDFSYNARMTTSADILKLFSKFSPRMEFTDSPSGFYGGLRDTFAQIAQEEEMACRWENADILEYPSFGSRDDDFQVVRQFYAVWGSFSTNKSFSWKDTYRYSEAPDRRVRRLMEKENKRLREAAIREFNDAVRSLVNFVKKRDPRYKAYKDSQTQDRESLRQSAAAQATRSRAANRAKLGSHVVQDWARSEEPHYDDVDNNDDDVLENSEEGEVEHFECIVCRKTFKSQNQFQAHERSKKHIKAVKQLRWEMRLQDEELDLQDEPICGANHTQLSEDSPQDDSPVVASTSIQPELTLGLQSQDDESNANIVNNNGLPNHGPSTTGRGNDFRPDDTQASRLEEESTGPEDDQDYAPREVLHQRLDRRNSPSSQGEEAADAIVDELSRGLSASKVTTESPSTAKVKVGKAKQKRAKKAQLAEMNSESTACSICNASFPSRNKLFSHIKQTHGRR
ncbi:hypothetical protein BJY01DRAFT_133625 [Aspergillus pseudoustus]|uniref:DnaJ domain-containing protein n=1 Tax=Aspergillus pseudoustus TaxID=1810923 RepID=A0ABR4IK12_9EURO